MQKLKKNALFLVALIPQFTINNYLVITVFVIIIGMISFFTIEKKNVFIKAFILELIIISIVLLLFGNRISYLNDVFSNLGVPSFLTFVVFVLFNALNLALLFFSGYTMSKYVHYLLTMKTRESK